jgi:hypothetical protein
MDQADVVKRSGRVAVERQDAPVQRYCSLWIFEVSRVIVELVGQFRSRVRNSDLALEFVRRRAATVRFRGNLRRDPNGSSWPL